MNIFGLSFCRHTYVAKKEERTVEEEIYCGHDVVCLKCGKVNHIQSFDC